MLAVNAPVSLRSAGLLVSAEALALASGAVGYAVSGVLGHPADRLATLLAAAMAGFAAAALLAAGRGLRAGRGWAWSPTVLAQLLILVVAVGLLQGRVWAAGGPLALLAAAVLYLLATPQARAVYRERS